MSRRKAGDVERNIEVKSDFHMRHIPPATCSRVSRAVVVQFGSRRHSAELLFELGNCTFAVPVHLCHSSLFTVLLLTLFVCIEPLSKRGLESYNDG